MRTLSIVLAASLGLGACAAPPQPASQQLAAQQSALQPLAGRHDPGIANSDGYVTGSHIRQDDLSMYDPALKVVGPPSTVSNGQPTATGYLGASAAGPDITFYNR